METHGPLWNTVTWMLQMMWISSEPSTFPHPRYPVLTTAVSHPALKIFCMSSPTANKSTSAVTPEYILYTSKILPNIG